MSDSLQSQISSGMGMDLANLGLANGGRSKLSQAQASVNAAGRATGVSDQDYAKARKAAEEFEAVFLSQMMQPIFDTIPEDSLFGEGPGHKVYQSMLVSEMGKEMARSGGVGIADHVFNEILKLQEG